MLDIPDKTYFKIGEAAKIVGVKPYIIRYWESEFRQLRLSKTRSGQRLFKREDIELLHLIRTLLYDRKYTVAGAVSRISEIREADVSYREFIESLENGDVAVPGEQDQVVSDSQLREEYETLKQELSKTEKRLEEATSKSESLEDELKEERLIAARALRSKRELEDLVDKLAEALRAIRSACATSAESSDV
jgi:DNA-binding transcriptional MerR regulator